MRAALLFAFGMLALQAGNAWAVPADDAVAAGLLGTYECNSGSTAIALANKPVKIDEYTTSNPLLRITITSMSKADVLWWDRDKQNWKRDPSADLKIKLIEAKEKFWTITLEGKVGDRIPAVVAGYLSWFASAKALGLSDKPTLVLTQSSLLFASASALLCDKL